MALSLSALCFFILTSSLHSFPLHFFVSHLLYLSLHPPTLLYSSPSLLHPHPFTSLLHTPPLPPHSSHITLLLHFPTPPPFIPPPLTLLLPHFFIPNFFNLYPSTLHSPTPPPHSSHISSLSIPSLSIPPPLHPSTPPPLHPSTPPHVLLDNEVTAVSTIWRAQPDSKTVSDR